MFQLGLLFNGMQGMAANQNAYHLHMSKYSNKKSLFNPRDSKSLDDGRNGRN